MKTFHGSYELKSMCLQRVRHAIEMGNLQKGRYGRQGQDGWVGCVMGVVSHKENTMDVSKEIGLPSFLSGDIIPFVFDHLPDEEIGDFAIQIIESIPVGAEIPDTWVSSFRLSYPVRYMVPVEEKEKAARSIGDILIKEFRLLSPNDSVRQEEMVIEEDLVLA